MNRSSATDPLSPSLRVGARSPALSQATLAAGVGAALAFFVGGWFIAGFFFYVSLALGVLAVVLGGMAIRRPDTNRRAATIGLVLGAIVTVWFVAFVVVDALS
jgi:hypothetical protein